MLKEEFNIRAEFERMSESLQNELSTRWRVRCFPKNSFLLKEGEVCSGVYFVLKGGCRSYLVNRGKEITTSLSLENNLTYVVDSFLRQIPSSEIIQAIENTECLYLSYCHYQALLKENLEFNQFVKRVTDNRYLITSDALNSIRTQSALERYECFMKNTPLYLQRVPLSYLASFLGMSKETLSRMRSLV